VIPGQRDRLLLGLAALVLVLLVVGGGIGIQAWRTNRAPTAVPSTAESFTPVTLAPGRPIVLGQPGAKVRVRLYEDFHCPHCADFEEQYGPTLTAAQERGTAAVELYPMAFIDAGSSRASNAMACASEAGFGQPYYLGLFANHELKWNTEQLLDLAAKVTTSPSQTPSLETPELQKFSACVRNDAHQSWVASINAAADSAGVTGTPTLFVDDQPVDLSRSTPARLAELVDQAAGQ
jgi:protein-disulfide isomerase